MKGASKNSQFAQMQGAEVWYAGKPRSGGSQKISPRRILLYVSKKFFAQRSITSHLVAVFGQLSGMAITNDLAVVVGQPSQMASCFTSSSISWDEMWIFRGSLKWFGSLLGLCLTVLSFVPQPALAAQEIKPFIRGSYQQIVASRQGKPFILNFWSLSCGYCKVELDMLNKLIRQYPKLDLVLVSTDTPEEENQVSAALAKFSLGKAEAWVFADSYTERLRFEVDKKWQGELPRTYFLSSTGEVTAISGKVEKKEVEQWIKEQYSSR